MVLTYREILQVGVLLLCVPAQYFLSMHMNKGFTTSTGKQIANEIRYVSEKWLSPQSWVQSLSNILDGLQWKESSRSYLSNELSRAYSKGARELEKSQSPAAEVLNFRQRHGYFAFSSQPRHEKPIGVAFRVGQVVKHRTEGYVGVIVGWDVKAKASETWLTREYGNAMEMRTLPHYAILVDERDTRFKEPEVAYAVQDELELMKSTEVQHWLLGAYFLDFDGHQYITQKWLKTVYPKD